MLRTLEENFEKVENGGGKFSERWREILRILRTLERNTYKHAIAKFRGKYDKNKDPGSEV